MNVGTAIATVGVAACAAAVLIFAGVLAVSADAFITAAWAVLVVGTPSVSDAALIAVICLLVINHGN
jgi:hypothetical protein